MKRPVLLLAITGDADFLITSLSDPTQRRYAEEIQAAGTRAADLTHQLLAFNGISYSPTS